MELEFSPVKRIGQTAFAFRGYNVANLGRTAELLAHPAYGPVVEACLIEASELCSEVLHRKVDLSERVRRGQETVNLETYTEDVALVIAAEIAHVRLLEKFFGASMSQAKLAFGYSLGEIAALIAGGVYPLTDLLRVPLLLCEDCVALAANVSMGVLFSRGPALDQTAVKKLCLQVSHEGQGVIDMSAQLSPNSVLLLGQGGSVDRFQQQMRSVMPQAQLRKKNLPLPPMHTAIIRQRAIAERASVLLQTAAGGFQAPKPRLLSGVTGKASYNDHNSRDLLYRWVDHPQQLWGMVHETLISGVEVVIHVGPGPNIIPATFKRLADDVRGQLKGYSLARLGLNVVSHLARRHWLSQLLPSATALLRAPFLLHVNLEDWLLDQKV